MTELEAAVPLTPSPQPTAEAGEGAVWLVWSNANRAYWCRPAGYTIGTTDAGRFTLAEAMKIVNRNDRRGHCLEDGDHEMPAEVVVPSPEYITAHLQR